MNRVLKTIGHTCTVCAAAGFVALGVITAATLIWVMMI